jgi:chaperonin GroES
MSFSRERISSIRPLHDRILIQKIDQEEKTAGGIFIPDAAKEKPQIGKVIATGPGKINQQGVRQEMSVKAGDTVYFSKFSGSEIFDDYLLIREEEALAIV